MVLTGQTRLAAVIGDPVRHSLSPVIHNAGFAALDLDWAYLAFTVPPGSAPAALEAMRTFDLGGLSVTMPHKEAVAAAVDRLTPTAETLGAVNCVIPEGSELIGDNTDGDGFLAGLAADTDIDLAGARALLVGGGGAARAVAEALGRAGAADVAIRNRTPERARSTAAMAGGVGRVEADGGDPAVYDLVVNATSLGMHRPGGDPDAVPVPVEQLRGGQVLVDLVYEPAQTTWLRQARQAGLEAHNGLSMLVHQAALAFARWTGRPAPIEVMATVARRALGH